MTDDKTTHKIYSEISKETESRSNHIIGLPPFDSTCSKALVHDFVKEISHASDDVIKTDLKKRYYLGSKIPRVRPHKSLKNKSVKVDSKAPNRGKKRMTCAERRKRGLLHLNKNNKTFEMFVPLHKMWKEYALQMLGIGHNQEKSKDSDGTSNKKFITILQQKVRKIEYFGSLLKVTKSRCSEYIGIEGIIIQETKNTFSFITVDNCVKIVPKLHSEFSFIVGNFGFSILGNHLHQRPVDKAKQHLKKQSLWL
ncbi:Ribonuclease P protein subunit p29 [Armadillidium vulgare]|nr:Ribonuclease P protein subunit p29 [Armadillidium vulgare]